MKFKEALNYIAGGTQLYSKKPDLYSDKYPYSYIKAKGIKIDNYIDFSTMSQGACILGYSNQNVNLEVIKNIKDGNISSLNSHWEIKLAKLLNKYEKNKLYRYFKSGGEALVAAIRIIRNYTNKTVILCNGYHGWHDWYLSSNYQKNKNHLGITTTKGVPKELDGTCYYFSSLEGLIDKVNKYNVAGVVLELHRYKKIDLRIIDYLLEKKINIIADEITTGWRNNLGGYYNNINNFNPDIVVYGKAISNGFPFSVVCGNKEIMNKIDETFISSTYFSDSIGMVAAYYTIKELEKKNYKKRNEIEMKLRKALYNKLGVNDGFNGMIHYYPKKRKQWIDFMLSRKYLVTDQIYLSFAHTENDVNKFIEVMDGYKE
jgi:glutamate-1-semialdehyde aminotransferase